MIKRISVEQLRLGMYIHEFCGSWINHPFWRSAFLLDSDKDLRSILSAGVKELRIDTAKGLDVAVEVAVMKVTAPSESESAQVKSVPLVDLAQEATRAVKICAKSKQAVFQMFQEARMGNTFSADNALPVVEEITNSVMRNPGALVSLARLKNKDDYTYMHSVAVCALMVALARQLKLDDEQMRQAGLAGLLHDIGKMHIPLDILNKPGKLNDAEFATVQNHPVAGHKLLQEGNTVNEAVLDVCLHHHEKIDGSGYPDKLSGDQISLLAKMGAICDVYDAVTSNRPYKKGWEPAEAVRRMAELSKEHFDATIFEAFVRSVGIYPIGSLVRLESSRLGIVIEQTEKSLLTPKVKVFFSIKSNGRVVSEILDLSKSYCKDKIISYEDPEKWKIIDIYHLWSGLSETHW